jgi:hypothetical protein
MNPQVIAQLINAEDKFTPMQIAKIWIEAKNISLKHIIEAIDNPPSLFKILQSAVANNLAQTKRLKRKVKGRLIEDPAIVGDITRHIITKLNEQGDNLSELVYSEDPTFLHPKLQDLINDYFQSRAQDTMKEKPTLSRSELPSKPKTGIEKDIENFRKSKSQQTPKLALQDLFK